MPRRPFCSSRTACASPMIWLAAARARRDLVDNGKGQTFVRSILFPAAFLVIVLVASRAYDAHGIPVLGPPKQPLYTWLITGGLIGSATWLTFAWVRHVDALTRALVRRPRRRPVDKEEKEATVTEALSDSGRATPLAARPASPQVVRTPVRRPLWGDITWSRNSAVGQWVSYILARTRRSNASSPSKPCGWMRLIARKI